MKNNENKLISILFILLALPFLGFAQDNPNSDLSFEVHQIYPAIPMQKAELKEVQNLTDLNKNYKSSWIKTYIAVEISVSYKGKIRKAISKNDVLSQKQKNLIEKADYGTAISVKVRYIPDNKLIDNDIKVIDFVCMISPEIEATYPDGQAALRQYLKDAAIDKIPESIFTGYALAAVKFTIDEKGAVTNVSIFESAKDEAVDKLLLNAIQNMSTWNPATFANGLTVKQEFVLTLGNMNSCVMNLLHIRRD